MDKIVKILSMACLVAVFASCNKDEIMYFDNEQAAVNFPGNYRDALVYTGYDFTTRIYTVDYSFMSAPLGATMTVIDVPVKVVGNVVDYDREVGYEIIADSTTAVAGVDYKILEAKIPAGKQYGHIRFEVNYKSELDNERDTLQMVLVDSKDLNRGTNEYNKGLIMWSNIIPAIPTVSGYRQTYNCILLSEQAKTGNNLIAYSPNAHRAILDALGWPVGFWGRYNASYDPYNNITVINGAFYTDFYAQMLKKYLDDYEVSHGERLKHNSGSQKGKDVKARVTGAVYVP